MVGTSSGTAPCARSRSESAPACSLVRGTSTRQPNSGLVSNHDSCAAVAAGGPATATAGPSVGSRLMPAAFRSAPVGPGGGTTLRCAVVVPFQGTAHGVPPFQPAPPSV